MGKSNTEPTKDNQTGWEGMYWYRVWNKTKGEDFTGANLKEPAAGLEAYTTQIQPSYKEYPSCCTQI